MMNAAALSALIEKARLVSVSAAQREAQRRSFAYGNAVLENIHITRLTIDHAADALSRAYVGRK